MSLCKCILKSEFTGRPEELLVIFHLGDAEQITRTHQDVAEIWPRKRDATEIDGQIGQNLPKTSQNK
mgnify:CR=1 FL=1